MVVVKLILPFLLCNRFWLLPSLCLGCFDAATAASDSASKKGLFVFVMIISMTYLYLLHPVFIVKETNKS
jgi:hypothetical protein